MPISFASIEILGHGPRICILDNFMEYKNRPPGLTRCYAGDGNIPPAERTSRQIFSSPQIFFHLPKKCLYWQSLQRIVLLLIVSTKEAIVTCQVGIPLQIRSISIHVRIQMDSPRRTRNRAACKRCQRRKIRVCQIQVQAPKKLEAYQSGSVTATYRLAARVGRPESLASMMASRRSIARESCWAPLELIAILMTLKDTLRIQRIE